MKIPLIKVKDTDDKHTHIVGTDNHDVLYIENNGGLQYINLQCCGGTKKFGGISSYEFEGVTCKYYPCPEILFVSTEDFLKIIGEQAKLENYPQLQERYSDCCKSLLTVLDEADKFNKKAFQEQMGDFVEYILQKRGHSPCT